MTDWEPYIIQTVPIVTLGFVYAWSGFELAVVVGLGMLIGAVATP